MDKFTDISWDCLNPKNLSMMGLDKFGDMLTFQIRRKNKYQTKVGGCCTIIFTLLVALTFGYYFRWFLNKNEPFLSVNEYKSDQYLDSNIAKEGYEYYFIP